MVGGEEVGWRLEQTLSHLCQQTASPPTTHLRGGAWQHDVAPEQLLLLAQSLKSGKSGQAGQWGEVEGVALGQAEVTGNVLLFARVTILELRMHVRDVTRPSCSFPTTTTTTPLLQTIPDAHSLLMLQSTVSLLP